MPVGIEAWVTQIPPVTRTWLALAVVASLSVASILPLHPFTQRLTAKQQCQLVTPLQLYFSFKSAIVNGQVRASLVVVILLTPPLVMANNIHVRLLWTTIP